MENYQKAFEILGLGTDSSLEEVRHAYRTLVRVWHPDRYSDDPILQQKAQERLKEINEAYRLARRQVATRKTEELPDSPFRFTSAPVTSTHATAHGAPSPPETSVSSVKRPAPHIHAAKNSPFGLNVLLLLLVLLCGWLSYAKYGFSLQSFTYFLQVMIVPLLCAFVCNTSYGESERLRIGYLSAILIFGTVIALDAVMLKRQSTEAIYTSPDSDFDGTRRFPRGDARPETEVHTPMGPSERLFNKGPQAPSSPDAPTAPLAPSPIQPAQPAVPRAGR